MKNPEIMDANGTPESLSIMFHKDNCSVIAIQDATEDSLLRESTTRKERRKMDGKFYIADGKFICGADESANA